MTRTKRMGRAVALALLLGLPATGVRAQDEAGDDSVTEALESVQGVVEQLRADNERMQAEIDELRSLNDDNWLTEARSEEIKSLVADVLADADTRASNLSSGMVAGWNERFFLSSPDGRFRLEMDGMIQTRFIWNYFDQPDRHRSGFEVTRARLTFRGHVFEPGIKYMIRMDKTRNDPGLVEGLYVLRDGWVSMDLNDQWSIRFGLFKVPFNREELIGPAYQQAVERSLVNENTNLGRSEGVEFTYLSDVHKLMFALDDGATDNLGGFDVAGGQPPNTAWSTEDVEWAVQARYEHLFAGDWRQFRDMTSPPGDEFGLLLGVGAMAQYGENNDISSNRRNENRWIAYTVDISAEWGGANVFGSFTHHYVDAPNFNLNSFGAVIQGGVYVGPKVEIFARWEYGWWDIAVADFHALNATTFGVNYYLDGHDMKWTTDLGFGGGQVDQNWDADIAGWRIDGDRSDPQIVFRTQFQLLF